MKITIATIGSLGDVQPYLALAVGLKRAGHAVRIATSEPFGSLVQRFGIEFASLGIGVKEAFGEEGRTALYAARDKPLPTFRALRRYGGPLIREGLERLPSALAGSELVLGQLLAPGACHYAERYQIPYLDAAYLPIFPTRFFPHPGAPVTLPRGLLSWLSYFAADQIFWQAFRPEVNRFRRETLGLGPAPLLGPYTLRSARRRPMVMGYSQEVLARPPDWPAHAEATGHWFLDEPEGWTPPPRIVDFIAAGPAPVYLGFGSMSATDPERVTQMLLSGVRAAGCRAILARGWGGLATRPDSESLCFVDDVPHSWLFPQMAGVVHHGGAGTTSAALRAGVPQFVVPFVADQPFWGHQVARLGVGPVPVPIEQLTSEILSRKLGGLADPETRRRAQALGLRIQAERGVEKAVAFIEHSLRNAASTLH